MITHCELMGDRVAILTPPGLAGRSSRRVNEARLRLGSSPPSLAIHLANGTNLRLLP